MRFFVAFFFLFFSVTDLSLMANTAEKLVILDQEGLKKGSFFHYFLQMGWLNPGITGKQGLETSIQEIDSVLSLLETVTRATPNHLKIINKRTKRILLEYRSCALFTDHFDLHARIISDKWILFSTIFVQANLK